MASLGAAAGAGGGARGAAGALTITSTHKSFHTSVTGVTLLLTVRREFANLVMRTTDRPC